MRINVVGYGTVGKAQTFLLQRLNHEVSIFDPYVFPSIKCPNKDVDLTFVCTPSNAVAEAVRNLVEEDVKGHFIIKSTTSVGTTESLMKTYGVHISHNPEFLREQTAYEDVLKPDRIIIGKCCEEHGEKIASLYASLKKPIYITNPATSEAVKVLSNTYLSVLITFWNEANELSQRIGLNISEVAKLVCADSRMSSYGTSKFGEPFAGKCLPACLLQLIANFRENGLNPLLFEAVEKYNLRFQK
jgi:UDPglucose 6-dehydrogenase